MKSFKEAFALSAAEVDAAMPPGTARILGASRFSLGIENTAPLGFPSRHGE
jgi:hypothetical protein